MAYVLNRWSDPMSGAATSSLTVRVPTWVSDVAVTKNTPTEAIVTTMDSESFAPSTYRFARNVINDVYAGSNIDVRLRAPERRGVSILAQYNTAICMKDADTGAEIWVPWSAHLVCKFPLFIDQTNEQGVCLETLVRTAGSLYEQSGTSYAHRLVAMKRGALLPSALR